MKITTKLLALPMLGLLCTALASFATTYYVNATTGSDANDGLSPGAAKRTIQAAIDAASSGATIQVAAGTYQERLTINKSLTLLGAQAGVPACGRSGDETEVQIPASSANPNVLVDIASGVANVTIDGLALVGSPVFHYADECVIRAGGSGYASPGNPNLKVLNMSLAATMDCSIGGVTH